MENGGNTMSFVINGDENVMATGVAEVSSDAPVTPLLSLKNRRSQIVESLYLDLRVPRWDEPEIYVRFKPVSTTKLNTAVEKRRKSKSSDWAVLANADMLIESCIGVYAVIDGDTENKLSLYPNNPNGAWTRFDMKLAESLGIEADEATDVVNGLYFTEGDLIDAANRLFSWSNVANEEADESF
jgi:hypothetical protein